MSLHVIPTIRSAVSAVWRHLLPILHRGWRAIILLLQMVFGLADAGARSPLLAGIVAGIGPGRASRLWRWPSANPSFSPAADPFSPENLRAAFHRKYGRLPETRTDCAAIESAKALANCTWPRRLGYRVLFIIKGDPTTHTYRAVVDFDAAAKLVQAVAAEHFGQCVDPDLSDDSWARRLRCCGVSHPDRNTPVARSRDYRRRHAGKVLWVAKLDVQSLHDTIPHSAVRRAIARALARASRRGVVIDRRVLRLIETMLASYSFGADVMTGASDTLTEKDLEGKVSWPLEPLRKFHRKPLTARIGVPQGSPFSDILANLVLHSVDGAVLGDNVDGDLFYVRWLDDLVIVHTDRVACEVALGRALEALHKLKLIPHEPRVFAPSDVEYWTAKSIAPTPWAPRGSGREWMGILGYEIKVDGEIRIRRETLQRHKTRLKKIMERRLAEFAERLASLGDGAAQWFAEYAGRSVGCLDRDLARVCRVRGHSWTQCFPLARFGGGALAEQAKDLDRFRRLLSSRYRRYVEQRGRQLGIGMGDVRGVRDHYRASYYFALVARFLPPVAITPVAPIVAMVEPEGTR